MSKKLFDVPLTFTVTMVAVIAADTAAQAQKSADEDYNFDDSNLQESNLFFDETDGKVTEVACARTIGAVSESTRDAEDFGIELEDAEPETE